MPLNRSFEQVQIVPRQEDDVVQRVLGLATAPHHDVGRLSGTRLLKGAWCTDHDIVEPAVVQSLKSHNLFPAGVGLDQPERIL